MKRCRYCKLEKELTEFHPNARTVSGYSARCLTCLPAARVRDARDYATTAEQRKQYARNYAATNPERRFLAGAQNNARMKRVPFALAVEDIIIPEFCPVLGLRLQRGTGSGGRRAESPSLDRLLPELGYVLGNVQVVSWRANRLKNDATLFELEAIVRNVKARLDAC